MMKINGAYTFQNANFARKNQYTENKNNESAEDLYKLFIYELKEMYWSEMIMVKALAKVIKNTSDIYLIQLLKLNLDITKYQIIRIEELFVMLDEKIASKRCEPLKEMLVEINEYIKYYEKGQFKDEIMMQNLQKIAQFKIDSYNSFFEYARSIGEYEVAAFILESLNEEIELDSKLAEMMDSTINSNISAYY